MPWETWSHAVVQASIDVEGPEIHCYQAIETFDMHCGEPTVENLQHFLLQAPSYPVEDEWKHWRSDEWLMKSFAFLALGRLAPPGVEAFLRPFLDSHDRRDRWLATIALARCKDERVFPLVLDVLLEDLTNFQRDDVARQAYLAATAKIKKQGNSQKLEEVIDVSVIEIYNRDYLMQDLYGWYMHQREVAANLLGAWGDQRALPMLRKALGTCWDLEQHSNLSQDGPMSYAHYLRLWHSFENYLAYALGCLGAWGALLLLDFPVDHLRVLIIYQILGYLNVSEELLQGIQGDIFEAHEFAYRKNYNPLSLPPSDPPLVDPETVSQILATYFGFSPEEQVRTITKFPTDLRHRNSHQ